MALQLGVRLNSSGTPALPAARDDLNCEARPRAETLEPESAKTLPPRDNVGNPARDQATGRSGRRSQSSQVTTLERSGAARRPTLSRRIPISISVRPTYRCSAASARGSAERDRRRLTAATPCWTAPEKAAGWPERGARVIQWRERASLSIEKPAIKNLPITSAGTGQPAEES